MNEARGSLCFVLSLKTGKITHWHAFGSNLAKSGNWQCRSEKRVAGAMHLRRCRQYDLADRWRGRPQVGVQKVNPKEGGIYDHKCR